jgi:hypothetical protein
MYSCPVQKHEKVRMERDRNLHDLPPILWKARINFPVLGRVRVAFNCGRLGCLRDVSAVDMQKVIISPILMHVLKKAAIL